MKSIPTLSAIFILGMGLSACNTLQLDRHTMSGYSNYEDSVFREVSLRELQSYDQQNKPTLEETPREHSTRVPAAIETGHTSLIEQSDIALGMQKEIVRESWGEPDYVDVSGNPKFENERWRFSVPIKTSEGYQLEERLVFFERGRVVGWSTR